MKTAKTLELSRKDELFVSPSGLISIAGGKLTGYRLMAKRVVDVIALKINSIEQRFIQKSQTHTVKLSGGDFIDEQDIIEFKDIIWGKPNRLIAHITKLMSGLIVMEKMPRTLLRSPMYCGQIFQKKSSCQI